MSSTETVSVIDLPDRQWDTWGVALPRGRFYKEFGARIAKARTAAQLSQAALAKTLGLTRTSITNIEKGRQPVQVDMLVIMARALQTEITALLPEVPAVPASVTDTLAEMSSDTRRWVERVIARIPQVEEKTNGTEILPSKTKSKVVASGRKR